MVKVKRYSTSDLNKSSKSNSWERDVTDEKYGNQFFEVEEESGDFPLGKTVIAIGFAVGVGIILTWLGGDSTLSFSNPLEVEYKVVSVYKGAVQLLNLDTGQMAQVFNEDFVKGVLSGAVNKGDIIVNIRGGNY